MRIMLFAAVASLAQIGPQPASASDAAELQKMVPLVPALIRAIVSPDLARPEDVNSREFATCLQRQGMNATMMRAAIRSAHVDKRTQPCLDKFIGL
jgi:hypothetical protein